MCSAFYDDHHHCYVEYKDGVSYPHHYPHAGHRFCPRSQHCEPQIARTVNTKNQLYGKALLDLSKKTEANLARLSHVMSQNPPRPGELDCVSAFTGAPAHLLTCGQFQKYLSNTSAL